jgi:hypothetical protein
MRNSAMNSIETNPLARNLVLSFFRSSHASIARKKTTVAVKSDKYAIIKQVGLGETRIVIILIHLVGDCFVTQVRKLMHRDLS